MGNVETKKVEKLRFPYIFKLSGTKNVTIMDNKCPNRKE
mgnify:CR=1 FL=1